MGEEGKKLSQMAKLFEKKYPGIKVDIQTLPWRSTEAKLVTAVVGEITPDVVQMGTTFVPKFAAMEGLQPLGSYLEQSSVINRDDFFTAPLKTATYRGNLYGIPWYIDTRVLFYRKDLLRKIGYSHPPRTWKELKDAAKKLTNDGDREPKKFGISLNPSGGGQFANFVWQNGGRIIKDGKIKVDSQKFQEALKFYISFFQERLAPLETAQDVNIFQAFESGFYPMFISGPWMIKLIDEKCPEIKGKWGVAVLPGKERRAAFVGGSVLSIFKNSAHPKLAWKFIQFVNKPENQVKWYEITRDLPSTKKAWKDPQLNKDERVAVFGEQLKTAQPPPPIPEWEEIRDAIGKDCLEPLIYQARNPSITEEKLESKIHVAVGSLKNNIKEILNKKKKSSNQSNFTKLIYLGGVTLVIILIIVGILVIKRREKYPPGGLNVLDFSRALHIPYLFMLPALAILFVFLFLPVIASFLMSLTDWNIYALNDWGHFSVIGFQNYKKLLWEFHAGPFNAINSPLGYLAFWNYLGDPVFWHALFNTFIFVIVGVPLSIFISLATALALNEKVLKGKKIFRAGYFMPVVTTMVAVAVVWRWLYNPRYGLINYILGWIGIPGQEWLSNPYLALPSLIFMAVWKNFGYNMIIFLAGLQSIPETFYEAAQIDGANRVQRFFHITLPQLKPTMYFVSIITIIGYFQFFAEPYIMTDGGPLNSTMSIVLYMYNHGFKYYNLGYASALAYILFIIICAFTIGYHKLSEEKIKY